MAAEIERRGFSGIYCPSFGDAMGLCLSIAHATTSIEFGTSIQPIYLQHPVALATSAAYLHELSGGRFRLGVGVTHGPVIKRLGVETGKPLSDMREYVGTMRAAAEQLGGLPPVVLATLRDKMVQLSVEAGDGAVWANASRSRMAHSLSLVPSQRLATGFWIGNMIPTVTTKVKAMSGNLPSVRIAAWAGVNAATHLAGVVETGPTVALSAYGKVETVSAIPPMAPTRSMPI